MKKMALLLLGVWLSFSCSHSHVPQVETLQANNTAGIVLRSKKAFCVDTPNAGPVAYCLISASHVPPNRKFYLQSTNELNPSYSPLELVSDDEGHLRLATDRSQFLDEYLLLMMYRHYGEICQFWLVSDDKRIVVQTSCVPYPLEAFGSDGAELSLLRLNPSGSKVRCTGKYFLPGEKLLLQASTKKQTAVQPIISRDGTFFAELDPPDPASFGEVITLEVKRQNGESITLQYPWGREAGNKGLLAGNLAKFKEEDYEKLQEAYQAYYLKKRGMSDVS